MATYEVSYRRIQVIKSRVVATDEDQAVQFADAEMQQPSSWTVDSVELIA